MKKLNHFIALLLICCSMFSCDLFFSKHKKTEFFIFNNTTDTIDIISTGYIAGPIRDNSTLHDIVAPGDTISMRIIGTGKEFNIKPGVFVEMHVYRYAMDPVAEQAIKDPLDQNLWVKTLETKSKKEFLLTIDNSFFKDNRSGTNISKDSILTDYSQYVLHSIKESDINKLANYIHPEEGVRFSPYGHIDIKNDRVIKSKELTSQWEINKKFVWGSFDGSGEPIMMTTKEYFKRFIYDIDFENNSVVLMNECKGGGNSLNNITEVYKGLDFIEYYHSGGGGMDGMDWKALRLVYKKRDGVYYLVGIIHDEWTI